MKQNYSSKDLPSVLYRANDYIVGTIEGIEDSDLALDLPFEKLAKSVRLQNRLQLLSACLVSTTPSDELIFSVAGWIADFSRDRSKVVPIRTYLNNGATVRIKANNKDLFNELSEIVETIQDNSVSVVDQATLIRNNLGFYGNLRNL